MDFIWDDEAFFVIALCCNFLTVIRDIRTFNERFVYIFGLET